MSIRNGMLLTALPIFVGLAAASANVAAQVGATTERDEVAQTLEAMKNASTWGHPDLFGMTTGMRRYAHHQYTDALHYFEIGARYADKLSQLSIGLMHLNGAGTPKNPVLAYAWLDLAAERGYPSFVATRDELKAKLSAAQLGEAAAIRAALARRYGDAVAKPRMAVELRLDRMQITGSRTGFDSGVVQIGEHCGAALIIGGRAVPQIGCGAFNPFLQKDNWVPDLYFAARDREWMPNVVVGPAQADGDAAHQSPTDATQRQ
jgi:TPR repeat protein